MTLLLNLILLFEQRIDTFGDDIYVTTLLLFAQVLDQLYQRKARPRDVILYDTSTQRSDVGNVVVKSDGVQNAVVGL